MNITIDNQRVNELSQAIEIGYNRCLRDQGKKPKTLSQRGAWRKYSRVLVEKWDAELLTYKQKIGNGKNSTIIYDAERLEVLFLSTFKGGKK